MRLIVCCFTLLAIASTQLTTASAQDATVAQIEFTSMPESVGQNKTFLVFSGSADWVLRQEHPKSRWASMSIEGLSLDCSDFKRELFDFVSKLKQVRWLELSCIAAETNLRSGVYDPLSRMTQLTHLELLYDERLAPTDLSCLASLSRLKDLTITPRPISLASFQLIAKNKNLENLLITGIDAANSEAGGIPTIQSTKLKHLSLGKIPSTIDLEKLLGNQPQLERLSFSVDKVSPKNVRYLRSLPPQVRLNVNGDAGWRHP
ncbi:hypothetical protein GC197_16045 [bacterium]|nr:hypothetical protein [bacterium]